MTSKKNKLYTLLIYDWKETYKTKNQSLYVYRNKTEKKLTGCLKCQITRINHMCVTQNPYILMVLPCIQNFIFITQRPNIYFT